jgi:hypothetical protein
MGPASTWLRHNHNQTMNHYRRCLGSYCVLVKHHWSKLFGAFLLSVLLGCLNHTPTTHDSMLDTWDCAVEARSDDTIIRLLPRIVSSHRFMGSVNPMMSDGWLADNHPMLEVWAHDNRQWHRSFSIPLDGRIAPVDLPSGRYCFRASAIGFVSVAGRIQIARQALDTPLDVRLPLAN